MKRVLTRENYFLTYIKKHKSFYKFFKRFQKHKISGRYLVVTLSEELLPFQFSVFLKSKAFDFFFVFLSFYKVEGLCVSCVKKMFGSRFSIRALSDNVPYERSFAFFSPTIINIQFKLVTRSGSRLKTRQKSKLYFIKDTTQKKLLANLFK